MSKYIKSFQDILVAFPQAVIVTNLNGELFLVNDATKNTFFGQEKAKNIDDYITNETFLKSYQDVCDNNDIDYANVSFSHSNNYKKQYFDADISKMWVDEQTVIVVVLHNITANRQAEKMRTDFISNVSHELRTPLSSIIGFLETLQGGAKYDSETLDKFLDIIGTESIRMKRVLDDLLELSKIEQDEHIIPQGDVDISSLLKGIGDGLSGIAKNNGNKFKFDFDYDDNINGNVDQLTQVFQNLMANAIKYSYEKSEILVQTKSSTLNNIPAVKISVSDKSEGIENKHLSRLTERFYRVDKSRSKQAGGTGLGLAIVKHIVSQHRGKLSIKSTVGVGSTFSVTLPQKITEGADE